ncbi:MAG: hypothetical protein QXV17_06505 [Candidatus Micrarchaeaceae archaeon]
MTAETENPFTEEYEKRGGNVSFEDINNEEMQYFFIKFLKEEMRKTKLAFKILSNFNNRREILIFVIPADFKLKFDNQEMEISGVSAEAKLAFHIPYSIIRYVYVAMVW